MTVDAKTMQAFITAMAAIQNNNTTVPQQDSSAPEEVNEFFNRTYVRINIVGNVGSDPVLNRTKSGHPVCNISVATNHRFQGQNFTDWHKVVCWGKLAEAVAKYVRKGQEVNVWANRAPSQQFTNKEGVRCEGREYWANSVIFEKKRANSAYTGDTTATTPAPQMEQNTNQNVDVNTMIEVMKQMGFVQKGMQEAPQEPAQNEDLAAQLNGGMSMGV